MPESFSDSRRQTRESLSDGSLRVYAQLQQNASIKKRKKRIQLIVNHQYDSYVFLSRKFPRCLRNISVILRKHRECRKSGSILLYLSYYRAARECDQKLIMSDIILKFKDGKSMFHSAMELSKFRDAELNAREKMELNRNK